MLNLALGMDPSMDASKDNAYPLGPAPLCQLPNFEVQGKTSGQTLMFEISESSNVLPIP